MNRLFSFFLFLLLSYNVFQYHCSPEFSHSPPALLVLCRGIFRAHCVTGMDDIQILLVGLSRADKT